MGKRDGRTEQPTPRKLREARPRRQRRPSRPRRRAWPCSASALIAAASTAPGAMRSTRRGDDLLARHGRRRRTAACGAGELQASAIRLFGAWSPMVLAAMAVGIAVQIAQSGINLAPKTARPSLKQLSLAQGSQAAEPGPGRRHALVSQPAQGRRRRARPRRSAPHPVATTAPISDDLADGRSGRTGRSAKAVAWRVVIGALVIAALDSSTTGASGSATS